jgi:cytochrome o ubiquinol oxidase subunit IV
VKHQISQAAPYSHDKLVAVIIVLAVSQLFVQLLFFLHLSRESRPRWNLIVLLFAAMVLLIVVLGSLWIMNNLNYHHPNQDQINKYIRSQGDL